MVDAPWLSPGDITLGHFLFLVIGHWSLVIGHWGKGIGKSILDFGFWMQGF
jgi:hypothetical protein